MDYCPFCVVSPDQVTLEHEYTLAFHGGYSVAQGRTLVIPRLHVASIFDLALKGRAGVWDLVAQVRARLDEALHPDAFTIGVNDGVAAQQTAFSTESAN